MIVVDTEHTVLGSGPMIYRTSESGEPNLIKVVVDPLEEFGFFYIGTEDRDLYTIYEDTTQPEPDLEYKFYVLPDGTYEYVEINQS